MPQLRYLLSFALHSISHLHEQQHPGQAEVASLSMAGLQDTLQENRNPPPLGPRCLGSAVPAQRHQHSKTNCSTGKQGGGGTACSCGC